MAKPLNGQTAKGFAMVPHALTVDLSVSPLSKCVYMLIVRYRGQNGSCWASQEDMAVDLGVTGRSIRKSIKQLATAGYIRTENRAGKTLRCVTTPEQEFLGDGLDPGTRVPHPRNESSAPPEREFRLDKSNNQFQESITRKSAESLGGVLEDVFGTLTKFEAPFNIRWRPPDDLKQRQGDVVRVMEAWHRHIGPVRTLTIQAGANICYRLDDWTVEELVRAVVGYAKATAKWRGNGRKPQTPTKFFSSDDEIQNYVEDGADEVPFENLPKFMRLLITREFTNVQFHRDALTKIEAQVEAGERSGSEVMNALNESHRSVDELLDKLERTTVCQK